MAKRLSQGLIMSAESPLSIGLLTARFAEYMLDSIRALEFYCGIGKGWPYQQLSYCQHLE
jgi:hypothetical protein